MLPTHAEYNLPFATKGKPPLANKGTKSLNLIHPLLILVIALLLALLYLILQFRDWSFHSIPAYYSTMSGDMHISDIKPCYTLHFTHNKTTYLMQPTFAKLAEGGITANTFSLNSARRLVFFCNLSSIFSTNHHFHLHNICL